MISVPPRARAIVSVALPLPLRREFSYFVPDGVAVPQPGSRVRVPFGERALTGVVVSAEGEEAPGMREIVSVLDPEPVCPPDLLDLARRTAARFFASTGEVLKSALPAKLPAAGAIRYRITEKGALGRARGTEIPILEALAGGAPVAASELPADDRAETIRSLEERGWIRPVSQRPERGVRVETAYAALADGRTGGKAPGPRGRDALAWLVAIGRPATAPEVRLHTGAGPGVLRTLVRGGFARSFEQPVREESSLPGAPLPPRLAVTPTPAQAVAIDALSAAIRERRYFPALLQGVTGSGKTEVYLRAISAALEAGRGAIWLVPEIGLTPVFSRELSRLFGSRAALLHSALSERGRAEAWDRVRRGEARAVIGPRSAVFAPVADPGVIVVDEEHDASYKQREAPRYDARDVAALRARAAGAALVFGSATPSVEAYFAADRGRLTRLGLPDRIDSKPLPDVTIVDLRREIARPEEKGVTLFSRPLIERLREVFSRKEQAILLQPRRGYAPFLLCRLCGHDFRCTRCSVCRTVHARGRTLICHYCGERVGRPDRCPECGGAVLEAIGAGTERVGERFAEIFPDVSHVVLDRDSARRRGGAGSVLEEFSSGRAGCLIGTQMVAKGHDFPNVTAVGVLSADSLLNFPDFRSAEKTFQLVAQVAGRAGRGDEPGTVHVQTFHPQHPAIRRASQHDVDGFCRQELEFRKSFFYPPFSELAAILVSSENRERAEETASELGKAVRSEKDLRISGPAPAPLERLQGRWRFQLLLRAADRRTILAALDAAMPERPPSGVQIAADVDPQDLL
ncbi:MAG: primosomal protein N' [Acidobacteriota bacterium]